MEIVLAPVLLPDSGTASVRAVAPPVSVRVLVLATFVFVIVEPTLFCRLPIVMLPSDWLKPFKSNVGAAPLPKIVCPANRASELPAAMALFVPILSVPFVTAVLPV